MTEWLTLIIIVVSCFLPGWLVVRVFTNDSRHFPGDRLAYYFAAFSAGVLLIGWLAFFLAEIGLFSIDLLGHSLALNHDNTFPLV